jgi:hypothetical protein
MAPIRRKPIPYNTQSAPFQSSTAIQEREEMGDAIAALGSLKNADVGEIQSWLDTNYPPEVSTEIGDAVEAVVQTRGGKKHRGGGKAEEAFKKITTEVLNSGNKASAELDAAAAEVILQFPNLIKGAAAASTLSVAVKYPGVFAKIGAVIRFVISTTAARSPSWSQALTAVGAFVQQAGLTTLTLGEYLATPAGAFLLASLVMRYRATEAKKTVIQLLQDDSKRIGQPILDAAGKQYNTILEYMDAQDAAKLQRERGIQGEIIKQQMGLAGLTKGTTYGSFGPKDLPTITDAKKPADKKDTPLITDTKPTTPDIIMATEEPTKRGTKRGLNPDAVPFEPKKPKTGGRKTKKRSIKKMRKTRRGIRAPLFKY